jgi:hypothetical protein
MPVAIAAVSPSVIGTVTSPGKIRLAGADLTMKGVLSWTLLSGDELNVTTAPALVHLTDGTRLLLLPETTVRMERRSSLTVIVLTGTVFASCERECRAKIEAGDQRVAVMNQKAVRISRHDQAVSVTTDVAMPAFPFPSSWLFQMFPYQTGIHLPEDRP